jgi:hypothetical protein
MSVLLVEADKVSRGTKQKWWEIGAGITNFVGIGSDKIPGNVLAEKDEGILRASLGPETCGSRCGEKEREIKWNDIDRRLLVTIIN